MDLRQDIKLLMSLQEIDIAIHNKEELCSLLPIKCKEQEHIVATLSNHIRATEEKIAMLKKQEQKLIKSVQDDMERLREKKNFLLILEDKKEYNTLIKEIDSLEKSNRVHEEEKLLLYEELSIQQEKLASYHTDYEREKLKLESTSVELEPTINAYKKERALLADKRAELMHTISPPMYARYEFIRSRIPYPILAPITQGICSACRIVLPTQIPVNVKTAQQIYTCPSCQRILYMEE